MAGIFWAGRGEVDGLFVAQGFDRIQPDARIAGIMLLTRSVRARIVTAIATDTGEMIRRISDASACCASAL